MLKVEAIMYTASTPKYVFPTVPIRQTKKPGTNTQIDLELPSAEKKALERNREACVRLFEEFGKYLKGKSSSIAEKMSSQESREKYMVELVGSADEYSSLLSTIVTKVPKYAGLRFYQWSSSLCDEQDIAFDDYRYELLGIYYNVAAIFMNIAQYLLCVRAHIGAIAPLEKDAYRALLKASAYFHICYTVVQKMKDEPVGVAELPVPLDIAQGCLTFLGDLSLAQAQEIGVSKAAASDPKGTSDTAARLCHQMLLMYITANSSGKAVTTNNEAFNSIITLVEIKCEVFRALAYHYAASSAFTNSPAEGVALLAKANQVSVILEDYNKRIQKNKMKVPFKGDILVTECFVQIHRSSERINKINSMVHRAQPKPGIPQLPAPQLLAIRPDITPPFKLNA